LALLQNLKRITLAAFNNFQDFKVSEAITTSFRPALMLPGMQDKEPEDEGDTCVRHLESILWATINGKLKIESLLVDLVGWELFETGRERTKHLWMRTLEDTQKDSTIAPAILTVRPSFEFLKDLRLTFPPDYETVGDESFARHGMCFSLVHETYRSVII
jgi:hypothetical protein